jgi:HPr kinase/phosphorylase
MATGEPTIHASAVLAGARAVLIRGPAGAGKSRLAWALIEAGGSLRFARLIGDDRVHLEVAHGRLLVRAAAALAGRIEIRGLGIRRLAFEPVAVVGLVIDLAASDGNRMPSRAEAWTELAGTAVRRLPIAAGIDPLPLVIAALRTSEVEG